MSMLSQLPNNLKGLSDFLSVTHGYSFCRFGAGTMLSYLKFTHQLEKYFRLSESENPSRCPASMTSQLLPWSWDKFERYYVNQGIWVLLQNPDANKRKLTGACRSVVRARRIWEVWWIIRINEPSLPFRNLSTRLDLQSRCWVAWDHSRTRRRYQCDLLIVLIE